MQAPAARRASPLGWRWLAVLLCAPWLALAAATAQTPPDTLPRDTVRVAVPAGSVVPDTLPTDSARRDSAVVVPVFPRHPDPRPIGWAFGRWEWDREALMRFHGLSVLELVEQVPGLVVTRAGDFGAPAGVSAFGLGGARLRVFVDGYELDALGSVTPELQRLGLAELETVRVERGPHEVRVELIPLRLPDGRPLSQVEAATGAYEYKLLRALLVRTVNRRSVVTGTYDLVSAESVLRPATGFANFRSPSSLAAARASWSYALGQRSVLQVDYRTEAVRRTEQSFFPAEADYRTLLLRGRSRLASGLVLDGVVGRSSRAPGKRDSLNTALASTQATARAAYTFARGWAETTVRARSGSLSAVSAAPLEVALAAQLNPTDRIVADLEARSAGFGGVGGLQWAGTVRAAPTAGLAAFATVGGGSRALGLVSDTGRVVTEVDDAGKEVEETLVEPRFTAVSSTGTLLRVGAEWLRGGALLGVAGVRVGAGTSAPFGLQFDRGSAAVAVDAATGVEARAILPVPRTGGAARLEGWYAFWTDRGGRPYLPAQHGRASLVLRRLLYEGQLEPSLRLDLHQRGSALVPARSGAAAAVAPSYALLDLHLQIRILDVRAFLVMQNALNYRSAFDIPGPRLPGGRFFYGVRWVFRD